MDTSAAPARDDNWRSQFTAILTWVYHVFHAPSPIPKWSPEDSVVKYLTTCNILCALYIYSMVNSQFHSNSNSTTSVMDIVRMSSTLCWGGQHLFRAITSTVVHKEGTHPFCSEEFKMADKTSGCMTIAWSLGARPGMPFGPHTTPSQSITSAHYCSRWHWCLPGGDVANTYLTRKTETPHIGRPRNSTNHPPSCISPPVTQHQAMAMHQPAWITNIKVLASQKQKCVTLYLHVNDIIIIIIIIIIILLILVWNLFFWILCNWIALFCIVYYYKTQSRDCLCFNNQMKLSTFLSTV